MSTEIPSATAVVEIAAVSYEVVAASLKSFDSAELTKLMKVMLNELEKKHKAEAKSAPTVKKEKKKGSMEKGKTPKQLLKNRAWVNYVLDHASNNGWEAFSVTNKKGASTEYVGSIVENGKHVFSDNKKPFSMKQAMSLSKIFWSSTTKSGTHQEIYDAFIAQYVEPVEEPKIEVIEDEPAVAAVAAAPKKTRAPKKTEEEKAAAKAEKKAAVKASKEAETASKAAPVPTPKKSPAKKVEAEFSCPNDGNVYTFTYKGKNYMRNFDGMIWEKTADGNPGKWAGMWNGVAIDDSVPEPEYDDEE